MRIAVVGAGPSGLAAAKTLIQLGLSPTVFEATSHLGGLWYMPELNTGRSRLYKSLRTNLSKFTCSFSDFPWKEDSPLFPSASDVHDYLTSYAQHFIPMKHIKLNTKVEYVQRNLERNLFELRYRSMESNAVQQDDFDCVIIATGFFNKPFYPPVIQTILDRNQAITDPSLRQQIIHSLEYYDPTQYADKTVAVIGGSFTGCEIAAELSKHAKQVHHVISNPAYIVPRYLPRDLQGGRTPFYPIDLVFYALSPTRLKEMEMRREDMKEMEKIHKTEEEVRESHVYFEKLDRYAPSPITPSQTHIRTPVPSPLPRPFVSISDGYYASIHAKKLTQHFGRLVHSEG
ncbi:NAD(P)/FAD-dependent oxidoreductase, partial [archaeon]